jgi:hypothetical protein
MAAFLSLVGLGAEIYAIYRILRSVGVGDSLIADARQFLVRSERAIRRFIRKLFRRPTPVRSAEVKPDPATAEVNAALNLLWGGKLDTDSAAPTDLVEVGRRLNDLAKFTNSVVDKLADRERVIRTYLDNKAAELQAEIRRETEAVDDRVEKEIRNRLRDRKQEGAIFAVGVLFQFAGAGVALAC